MVMALLATQAWRPPCFDYLLAEQAAVPLLERLDPPRRAAVIMAILALVLTGMLLVAVVMIGARWVRRMARHEARTQRSSVHLAAGTNRQLRQSLQGIVPDVKTNDTIQIQPGAGDTKVD